MLVAMRRDQSAHRPQPKSSPSTLIGPRTCTRINEGKRRSRCLTFVLVASEADKERDNAATESPYTAKFRHH